MLSKAALPSPLGYFISGQKKKKVLVPQQK